FAACKPATVAAPIAPPPVQTATGPTDEPTKALPPDLYKEMPIYPGAVVDHVRKPKGAMREIMFLSDAQMPQMVAYYQGRPGSIMLYPSDQDKSKMTIDVIYELPAHVDESMIEPTEDFDVEGPG